MTITFEYLDDCFTDEGLYLTGEFGDYLVAAEYPAPVADEYVEVDESIRLYRRTEEQEECFADECKVPYPWEEGSTPETEKAYCEAAKGALEYAMKELDVVFVETFTRVF